MYSIFTGHTGHFLILDLLRGHCMNYGTFQYNTGRMASLRLQVAQLTGKVKASCINLHTFGYTSSVTILV